MTKIIYNISPVAKPRMTQRDKWAKRPAVMKYRAFCDKVRLNDLLLPDCGADIVFGIPMPKSWSAKKKQAMNRSPHQQTPDLDNLLKALCDAVHKEDKHIWQYSAGKVWAETGYIEITTERC